MRTKFIIFGILILTAIILIAKSMEMQGAGPHGGELQKAVNYFIEADARQTSLCAYLYTQKMKPVSGDGISCKAVFHFGDNGSQEKELRLIGKDGFCAELPPMPFYSCKVVFSVYGKEVSATFASQNPIVKGK